MALIIFDCTWDSRPPYSVIRKFHVLMNRGWGGGSQPPFNPFIFIFGEDRKLGGEKKGGGDTVCGSGPVEPTGFFSCPSFLPIGAFAGRSHLQAGTEPRQGWGMHSKKPGVHFRTELSNLQSQGQGMRTCPALQCHWVYLANASRSPG